MTPQSQPQNSIPMVAATGPMFTREPMNFGTSKFEEIMCRPITVSRIMTYGPTVSN